MTLENLSQIKIMSMENFANVTTTLDNTLYFIEEDAGEAIEECTSTTSGYFKLPQGICVQWGRVTVATNGTLVSANLAVSYTNTDYAVLVAVYNSSATGTNAYAATGYAYSASQVKAGIYPKNSVVCWMTIGQA